MKTRIIRAALSVIVLSLTACSGCVSAKAKTHLASDNQIGNTQVEQTSEQKITAPIDVRAEHVEGVTQTIKEQFGEQNTKLDNTIQQLQELHQNVKTQLLDKLELFHSSQQAETIQNGGAGWTLLTAIAMVVLFVGTVILIGWLVVRRLAHWKGLLTLVTAAVQKSEPQVQKAVKGHIEHETSNGGPFGLKHKEALAKFTRNAGTFAMNLLADSKIAD